MTGPGADRSSVAQLDERRSKNQTRVREEVMQVEFAARFEALAARSASIFQAATRINARTSGSGSSTPTAKSSNRVTLPPPII